MVYYVVVHKSRGWRFSIRQSQVRQVFCAGSYGEHEKKQRDFAMSNESTGYGECIACVLARYHKDALVYSPVIRL